MLKKDAYSATMSDSSPHVVTVFNTKQQKEAFVSTYGLVSKEGDASK